MAVKINEGEFLGCGMCADACPQTAITVEDVAKVDEATCIAWFRSSTAWR